MDPLEANRISILFIAPNPKDLDQYYRALKEFQTLFVSESSLAFNESQKKHWDVIIVGDHLESHPLDFIGELKKGLANDPAFILILKPGHEKLAIKAIKMGIQEYLFQDELVPSIIHLIVNKSMEQKRWQRVYENARQKANPESAANSNIFNQTFLEMRLTEELKRSQRYRFPVTFLLIDIMNGQENEPSMALKAIHHQASILSKNIRSSDMLGILDDGKVGIILPHTNLIQAKTAWERLNKILGSHPFLHEDRNVFLNPKGSLMELNAQSTSIEKILRDIQSLDAQEDTTDLTHPDLN